MQREVKNSALINSLSEDQSKKKVGTNKIEGNYRDWSIEKQKGKILVKPETGRIKRNWTKCTISNNLIKEKWQKS